MPTTMSTAAHLRLPRWTHGVALTGIFLSAAAWPAANEVTLNAGANLAVTATADGLIVFDLIRRIWGLDRGTGVATQLSADDEIAQQPTLSPDGRYIAYNTIRDGYEHVMVRDADGGRPRQITFGEFNHRAPMWSPQPPDSSRIVMSSDRAGNFGLWEVDVETLDLQQLTFARGDEREPAWRADGSDLAYVTDTPTGTAIWAVRPDEPPRQLLAEKSQLRAPAWRPGGGVLSYVRADDGSSQLRMLILSTPAITKPITTAENVFPYRAHWINRSTLLYTADGQIRQRDFGERNSENLAFTATIQLPATEPIKTKTTVAEAGSADFQHRAVVGSTGRSRIRDGRYIVSALGDLWEIAETGELRGQLTSDPYVDVHPSLSPDGKQLVYVSDRSGSLQIWHRDLTNKREQRLTKETGIVLHPAWSADAKSIEYFSASYAAASQLTRKRLTISTRATATLETLTSTEFAKRSDGPAPEEPLPLTWRPFKATGRQIVQAARIFDGLGPGYLFNHEIVIEDDRIVEVRPWTNEFDDNTRVIDARSKTVIPGLIDGSTHQGLIDNERVGRQWLAYGVTTIREIVRDSSAALARLESWHSGRRAGPRLLLTGAACVQPPPATVARPVLQPSIERSYLLADIDRAVTLESSTVGLCPSLNVHTRKDMISIAHANGLGVRTHEPFPDLLLGAGETRRPPATASGYADFPMIAGALAVTVTTNLSDMALPDLVAGRELVNGWQYRQLFTQAERDAYQSAWRASAMMREVRRKSTKASQRDLLEAAGQGARIVTGSDAPLTPPGLGLHGELRVLGAAGLQPFQILRMATLDAGRALDDSRKIGAIRAGFMADLLIIDGDPLADIREVANIEVTMIGGRPYSRQELRIPGARPGNVGNFYNSWRNPRANLSK